MAGVQDLILAAQAKHQRPKSSIGELSDIINGGLDTYTSTKDQYLDIHRKIIEQKMLQEKQLKDQQDAQRKAQEQAAIKERFKAAQGQPTASNPADRLAQAGRNEEFKVNEAGDWSMESKPTTAKDVGLDDYLEEAVRTGKMSLQDAYKLKNTSGGGVSNDLLYRMDKDRLDRQTKKEEDAKKITETQVTAGLFGTRAQEANDQLELLMNGDPAKGIKGWDPTTVSAGVQNALPNALGGNFIRSPESQKFRQAGLNFTSALLRKESGAVISPSEYKNAAQQYLDQPGDTPEVRALKKQNRDTAIRQILAGAKNGGTAESPSGPSEDQDAIDWAKANPNDPRAAEIRRLHGL